MPIQVLYVVANLDVGGAEQHITQVVTRINQSIVSPSIFAILNKGKLASQIEKNCIRVTACKSNVEWLSLRKLQQLFRIFSSAWKLYRYLRNEKPDIVHFFLPMPYIIGGFVSIGARVPIRIMSRRSLNHYQKGHVGSAVIEHWLHQKMSKVLGNSQAVIDELHNDEGVALENLKLIYNGVHVPEMMSKEECCLKRESLNCSESEFILVIVANLIPYKGHSDLLNGLSEISDQLPEHWSLLCVGNDNHRIGASLESQVESLNLKSHIRFLGGRDDVSEILQISDVSILSSHEEGFSNAVLEGMAAGLPSVVTHVGGNAEAVRDKVDGYVVEAKSPDLLGDAILALSMDETLRKTMGASARKRVQEMFSFKQCLKGYEKLYQEVTAK